MGRQRLLENPVVYAYAKILILKQITTPFGLYRYGVQLYMPMQRY